MRKTVYFATILVVALIQLLTRVKEIDRILFILKPVTLLVSMFTTAEFHFVEGAGFVNEGLQVVIGKACAGGNFFSLLFAMLVFSFIPVIKGKQKQLKAWFLFLLSAYGLTIVANSSRIISTLLLMRLGLLVGRYQSAIHQLIGIVFYFSYLVIAYVLVNKILKKRGVDHGTTL